MPFQTGVIKIQGTIGDVTFYYRKGKYLCRRRTSLNKERIMKDPAFAKTRQYLPTFGAASKIAAAIYKQLSVAQKRKVHNSRLIKEILPLIKEKWGAKKIMRHMQQRYGVALKGFKTLRSFIHNVRTASVYYSKPAETANPLPSLRPGLSTSQPLASASPKPPKLLTIPPLPPGLREWGSSVVDSAPSCAAEVSELRA